VVFSELQKEEVAKKVCIAQLARLDLLTSLAALDSTRIERALAASGWPT
jgi:hypothetical protein